MELPQRLLHTDPYLRIDVWSTCLTALQLSSSMCEVEQQETEDVHQSKFHE